MREPSTKSVQAASFSGHETFVFRYAWLKKAADEVAGDPTIFTSDEAMVRLGVGKNMVRSIRHWGLATRILEEAPHTRGQELKVSELGTLLFGTDGTDLYLEDVNTLWLLHWNLATNEQRSTSWNWIFSSFPSNEFTRDSLTVFLQLEADKKHVKIASESSLRRDVDCFIRCYTPSRAGKGLVFEDSLDCPLVELGLIDADGGGLFRFNRGPKNSLSDEVFAYCLNEFWGRVTSSQSLAFSDIAYGPGSPGVIFKLDENSLIDRLDRLEAATEGLVSYTENAGLKQAYRRDPVDWRPLLRRHYERSLSGFALGA